MKKKLYLILPILIIISLLSFAAICNSGQDQSDKEVSDQTLDEEAKSEDKDNSQKASDEYKDDS